jgi:hypothetical protein
MASESASGLSFVWGNVPGSMGAADALGATLAMADARGGGGGIGAIEALSAETSAGGSPREHARSAAAMIAQPGLGGIDMKSILLALPLVIACDPPPQGPQQVTYQNGYAQQGPAQQGYGGYGAQPGATSNVPTQPITYSPAPQSTVDPGATMTTITAPGATVAPAVTATVAAPPVEIQTTPVPLGVQPLPLPSTTTVAPNAPPVQQTQSKMATPGTGAFQCTSDAQCLLGKCNVQFGRCAYPCKSSENDCKAGNVCTASGVCLPKAAAGVKM